MNGFIKRTAAGLALSAGLCTLGGCTAYRECVDPCYPERYNFQARMAVKDTFNAQAQRGHMLDQTIWSHHFVKDPRNNEDLVIRDPKTKEEIVELTPGAREHLKYIAFRQPVADPVIMLQRDPNSEVNFRRKVAIENYLTVLAPGRPFTVEEWDVRDISPVVLPPRYQDEKGAPNPAAVNLLVPKLVTNQAGGSGGGGGAGGQ